MKRINAVSPSPNHVMQSLLGRRSGAGIAVCVASFAIVGLTSAPMVAHAVTVKVGCPLPVIGPGTLIADISSAVNGDILSLAEGCIYTLLAVDPSSVPNLGNVGLPVIKVTLTIKGNGATITRAQGAPAFRIFQVGGVPSQPGKGDLTITNLTVDNGDAEDGGALPPAHFTKGRGGGIYNLGTLKVINGTLSHNHASVGGGGIGNGDPAEVGPAPASGNLTIDKGTLLFNNSVDANGNGGGIASGSTSTMNLTDCTISDNFANLPGSGGGPSGGGGIASQGTAILNKCTITGNTAFTGGGISNAGQLLMTDSRVTSNHAIADNSSNCQFTGLGGGIYNAPVPPPAPVSTVTLIHSPVTGNEAIAAKSGSGCNSINDTGLGGGILNAAFKGVFGTARFTDSDVSGNSAASGGGIANVGPMTLTHSNVTGNNSTGDGGGIFNLTDRGNNTPIAALTLTHSDVTDNHAGGAGGGIFSETGNKVTLNDSTVTGNTPDEF
jgi:hypothetical protein